MKKLGYLILLLSFIAGAFGIANASSSYLTNFSNSYPGVSSALSTCNLCHVSTSPPSFNSYGTAFLNSAHNFQAIENLDSDSDGLSNIAEIDVGTFPGDASSKPATPPAGTGILQMPVDQMHNFYPAAASPVISSDPSQSQPVAVGGAAVGGNILDLRVAFGGFAGDVDIYFAMGITGDPENLYFLMSDDSVQAVSIEDIVAAMASGILPVDPWKAATPGAIDEILLSGVSVSNIPAGTYTFYAVVTSPGSIQNFYLWTTEYTVQGADVLAPQAAVLEAPRSQMGFSYPATEAPVLNNDAAKARPLGMGAVASGGDVLTLRAGLGEFVSPVDLYFAFRMSSDPWHLYFLGPDYTIESVPFISLLRSLSAGSLPAGVEPWKRNTTGPVDEIIVNNLPLSNIAPGSYYFYLMATPADSPLNYYIWNTEFTAVNGPVQNGATLYSQSCASCHGTLSSSTKTGTTATNVQNAINGNAGGMGSLSNLTSTQVQAIADVLAAQTPPTTTPPPPTTTDGATLYSQSCASCHGTLSSSTKTGTTATKIQNAIDGNKGGMGSLSNLTSTQVQAIANVLAAQTPPTTPPPPPTTTDGATLYSQSCASCHGTLSSSTKTGTTATKIQNAIDGNKGGMGSLSNLTSTQVQAIADVLAAQTPIPPAVNHSENWYKDHRSYVKQNGTLECVSCHGADLTGGSGPSCYSCHGKKW